MDFSEERKSLQYEKRSIQIDRKTMQIDPKKSISEAKRSAALLKVASEASIVRKKQPYEINMMPYSGASTKTAVPRVKTVIVNDTDIKIKEIEPLPIEMMPKQEPPPFLISVRFFLAMLAFLAYTVQYTQKTDISVAIVCMVNNTALALLNGAATTSSNSSSSSSSSCPAAASEGLNGPFVWNSSIQGLLLCAYFIGYMVTEIPGGILSLRFGSKVIIDMAILIGSIFTLLIPVLSRVHWGLLFACRLIVGAAHGTLWPAFSGFWAQWAPPAERSRLIGIANAGSQIGNVIAFPLGSYLCVNGFDDGWGSIFYVFGAFGLVWFVLWTIFSSNSPGESRLIGKRERDYILEETKEIVEAHHKGHNEAPWFKIFKSKACWAIFISHTCSNWGTYLFLTQLPTYMKSVLKFDIHANGLYSALPYIVFWFSIIVSGILGDQMMIRCKVKKTFVRKMFNTLGFVVPMGSVIGLVFVTCTSSTAGIILLCLAMAFTGCCYGAGFLVNYNDIAGPFSGIVFGIGNTFATIPGIIAPYLVGLLTPHQTQSEWQIVFIITAIVYGIGGVISIIFTHSSVQPWAVLHEIEITDKQVEEKEKKSNIISDEHILATYLMFEGNNDEKALLEAFRSIRNLRILHQTPPPPPPPQMSKNSDSNANFNNISNIDISDQIKQSFTARF